MPLMFGFNWIDAIIIALLLTGILWGVKLGILSQLFAIAGFFATLFIAGWIFPHLLPIHNRTIKLIVNGNLVLLAACYVAIRCYGAGQDIHWAFRFGKLRGSRRFETVENISGALPGLLAGLVLAWLLGAAIGRLPFMGFSNSVSDSRIMQGLTQALPPVPAVFMQFDRHLDPNLQPAVVTIPKASKDFSYVPADVQTAATKAASSVVRITSFSCGGITSGTGFMVDKELVATNAHVIAGARRPVVKYNGRSYVGVPIAFDAFFDLAILRVSGLPPGRLNLAQSATANNSTVAVIGYPGGNFEAAPGIVRNFHTIAASSIYDLGVFQRDIYEIQSPVDYGSSGSPVVRPDGQVIGMIFSKSERAPTYGYAIAASYLADVLPRAELSHQRVSTGACIQE